MTEQKSHNDSDQKTDKKGDVSRVAQVDLTDKAVSILDIQKTDAGLHVVSPDELAKIMLADGLADALPKGVGLIDVADALAGHINTYFEGIARDTKGFDGPGLDRLNKELGQTLEQFGVNLPDNGPAAGFGVGLGMYMDGHGSTDGYDVGDYFIGLGKVAVGIPLAIGGAVLAGGGEVATLGSTEGAAFAFGVGLSVVGGGLAWDGAKEMAGEMSDAVDTLLEEPAEDSETDTPTEAETLDGGAAKEQTEGAGDEEEMTFTYEEVYGEPDPDAEGEDEDQSGSESTDDADEDGMTFTYEEVYGEPDPDADDDDEDSGSDEQMPVSPDGDTSGGLSREQFEALISGPNYGSSTGEGTMMPAQDDYGSDGFVFTGPNYGSSTGAGVMMPQQDDSALSPEELAIMLSGPNYGSSTGAGVMTPPLDEGGSAGPVTGLNPEPLGGDGSQFDFG